jgi:N-acetylglucosaminyl-diphospho-decaprenol L-rhamnosyltransferase
MAENVGFAAAANHGAAHTSSEILIFVNPASFPSADVLDALAAELKNDPSCASCAPSIVQEDGHSHYGGGGWLPTIPRAIIQALGLHRVLRRSGLVASPRVRVPLDVDWLAGTCLAVRRSVFDSVGGFDDRFFLYNEDMGLGRRLRAAGHRQRLRSDLLVSHLGGASSRSVTPLVCRIRAEAMVDYLHSYHGRWQALTIRAVLAIGYLLRALAYGVLGRWSRTAEMRIYLAAILRGQTEGGVTALIQSEGTRIDHR